VWSFYEGKEALLSEQRNEDLGQFIIVMNHEEQYSIWSAEKQIPLGWRAVGQVGSKQECVRQINEMWIDMRPLSLRRAMSRADSPGPSET
jgi:MbtH protein